MKRDKLLPHEFYHICNRGSSGMKIFKNAGDFLHFLLCLKEYNTEKNVDLRLLYYLRANKQNIENDLKNELVEIIGYCLLPDHYHLILKQKTIGGISKFMKKLGTGYTMYFNHSHKNYGHIFCGKYFSEIVPRHLLLKFLNFLHLNPLKKDGLELFNFKPETFHLQKLSQYAWSSFQDYTNLFKDISMIETKHVKPPIFKEEISLSLGSQSYENFLLNFWQKDQIKIHKHMT